MTVPGYDPKIMNKDNLKMHNVIEQRYYSLNLKGILRAGTPITLANPLKAVIDSGTSAIVADSAVVDAMIGGIEVNEDCSNLNTLPDITFQIDDRNYVLTGKEYVIEVDDAGEKACVMGILGQQFPEGFNYIILGDSFMRRYLSYFNKDTNQVGFTERQATVETE